MATGFAAGFNNASWPGDMKGVGQAFKRRAQTREANAVGQQINAFLAETGAEQAAALAEYERLGEENMKDPGSVSAGAMAQAEHLWRLQTIKAAQVRMNHLSQLASTNQDNPFTQNVIKGAISTELGKLAQVAEMNEETGKQRIASERIRMDEERLEYDRDRMDAEFGQTNEATGLRRGDPEGVGSAALNRQTQRDIATERATPSEPSSTEISEWALAAEAALDTGEGGPEKVEAEADRLTKLAGTKVSEADARSFLVKRSVHDQILMGYNQEAANAFAKRVGLDEIEQLREPAESVDVSEAVTPPTPQRDADPIEAGIQRASTFFSTPGTGAPKRQAMSERGRRPRPAQQGQAVFRPNRGE